MKRHQDILAYIALSLLFALAFGLGSVAAAQEATTPSESAVTCCSIRVVEFELRQTSARVAVRWIRSDGSTHEERGFAVTDGDSVDVTDNWLWGTGIAPQPRGLMRAVGTYIADETGTLPQRFQKAILRWLRDNGRIGASEITIP